MNYDIMLELNNWVKIIDGLLWGWPLVIFVIAIGLFFTFQLNFLQFRYFTRSWNYLINGVGIKQAENYITPFQAFLNVLSASIGNGSIAGMAVAIVAGGPGAAFWIAVLGLLYLIIRYAEVYLSTAFYEETEPGVVRGGPMVYLKKVPCGKTLAYLYALFMLGFAFVTGNGMQCNSMALSIQKLTTLPLYIIGLMLFGFILYIMFGGAQRILKISEALAPIKVTAFVIPTIIALVYHYQSLWPALKTIMGYALTPQAFAAGVVGFSVQQAIRFGMSITINSTEVGLGTAGIFYGSTKTNAPVESSIMSMATAFVPTYCVGFMIMLLLVASGVWNSGATSSILTMQAYSTVFGVFGDFIVAFLAITFGAGVLVGYAYIGRECWAYITNGRWMWLYTAIYTVIAFFGSLAKVDLIWNATGILNACLLIINLFAVLYLSSYVKKGFDAWQRTKNTH